MSYPALFFCEPCSEHGVTSTGELWLTLPLPWSCDLSIVNNVTTVCLFFTNATYKNSPLGTSAAGMMKLNPSKSPECSVPLLFSNVSRFIRVEAGGVYSKPNSVVYIRVTVVKPPIQKHEVWLDGIIDPDSKEEKMNRSKMLKTIKGGFKVT